MYICHMYLDFFSVFTHLIKIGSSSSLWSAETTEHSLSKLNTQNVKFCNIDHVQCKLHVHLKFGSSSLNEESFISSSKFSLQSAKNQ